MDIIYDLRQIVTKTSLAKGNFTLYLREFPDVRIQLTTKQCFLKLHGVKPYGFLLDLNIIRRFTSLFGELYPIGIEFKLDKETHGFYDKDLVVQRQEMIMEDQMTLLRKSLEGWEQYQSFIKRTSDYFRNDVKMHNLYAEEMNNALANGLCKNGFRCILDGSLIYTKGSDESWNQILGKYVEILLESGFLLPIKP